MAYDILIGRGEEDRKRYNRKGMILLGKHYVKMGQITSLSNEVYMDVVKSHIVFVVGKRGSGKCLIGDTIIALNDGSLLPISELASKAENVYSLNHELKIADAQKTEFYKRTVNKLLHVKFRSGKELRLTPEHPLLTIERWKEAKDLDIGSRIATPRVIPCFGNNSIPEHEIKIIAYLITEGHTKRPMFFSNNDSAIIKDLEKALKDLNLDLELTYLKKGCYKINSRKIKRKVISYNAKRTKLGQFGKTASIEHEKTPIRQLAEKGGFYNKLCKEKTLPNIILQLPKNQLALFLNRAFSCDGSIYKPNKDSNYWEICYSTSSEELARQIQHLLLRFGILSRLRTKKIKYKEKDFTSYEVVLDGENVKKFIHEIGFFGEKEKRQFLALQYLKNKKHNPNVDTIPKEIWNYYRPKNWAETGRSLGYAYPKALRESIKESIKYSPSRQKLLQIALSESNERLRLLAESDIFWDEIVDIKELQGTFEVFDITVPKFHNFIANDIIVHNSYTMGIIAEGVADLEADIASNISVIILDTMGIYWTMKYPNDKEKDLLAEWGMKPKGLNVNIYTPTGYYKSYKEKGIATDFPFSLKPCELSASDWAITLGISLNDPLGTLIERVVTRLKDENVNYSVDDLIKAIKDEKTFEQSVKDAAENKFINAKAWGLFSERGTSIEELAAPGQVSVLDVSCYSVTQGTESIRALVIGLVAKKLFSDRMVSRKAEEYETIKRKTTYIGIDRDKKSYEKPLVWLIIDEAHEFLPNEGKTTATDALITILREGRQPGISLVLASQQPGKIHTDVMTQADIIIAHRITANVDVVALGMLMQSYMREGLDKQLNYLPRVDGAAIIFDDTNERLYPMRPRPRLTWHGGESPTAIIQKEKIFESF